MRPDLRPIEVSTNQALGRRRLFLQALLIRGCRRIGLMRWSARHSFDTDALLLPPRGGIYIPRSFYLSRQHSSRVPPRQRDSLKYKVRRSSAAVRTSGAALSPRGGLRGEYEITIGRFTG